jgi:hypothetical protein
MATKTIPWETGGGSITVTHDGGTGNDSPVISSSANEGIDRAQVIIWKTTAGGSQVTRSQAVSQSGRREVFNAADGGFLPSDGGTFNVLKT